jgi:hypothetical protein
MTFSMNTNGGLGQNGGDDYNPEPRKQIINKNKIVEQDLFHLLVLPGGDGAVSHLDVLGDAAILVQACWRAMTAVLLKGRSVLKSWSLEGHLAGHGARPV